MNIVFGNMVGSFNAYGSPENEVSEADFRSSIDSNAYVFCVVSFVSCVSVYADVMEASRLCTSSSESLH